jgi:cyclopropane-fatty-acyl-phospholipid synthase
MSLLPATMFPPAILFKFLIRQGSLDVADADGKTWHFKGKPGLHSAIKINDKAMYWKILYNPYLYLAEAYMHGQLTIEQGTLDDLQQLIGLNQKYIRSFPASKFHARLRYVLRKLWQDNSMVKARRNVSHHYDISNDLYKLFLDKDMQYSCAYFRSPTDTLEQAQQNKKNHIIAKLQLEPGMRVLDIGCGWGGLGIEMARQKGVTVTGVTLSTEQYDLAVQRAKDAGVADKVTFKLLDYRKLEGSFDRIVSVGMFEHVGMPHYKEFFTKVNRLLTDDGIALLHSIGYAKPSLATNPWLEKYIYPKGYLPALSETIPSIERAGFWISDVETLRLHYGYTLREWKNRFRNHREQILGMYDEAFYRMFDLYLSGCEMAMLHGDSLAWQIQFAKKVDAVPITRDYIYADAGAAVISAAA